MFDPKRYPVNWKEISHYIRFVRAGGRCEGSPAYPDCRAEHGKPHPITGSKVILTTAHLGIPKEDGSPGDVHDKMDVRPENLRSWCQRCHLFYDLPEHIAKARETRQRKRGQLSLYGEQIKERTVSLLSLLGVKMQSREQIILKLMEEFSLTDYQAERAFSDVRKSLPSSSK